MRTASRLLAQVKPARFLEAGNPTGLTGLYTHPAPRSTLLYLYNFTLDKLKAIPEHSIYRQSAERIIQHRMNIVESIKPQGYDEWAERAKRMVEKYPHLFNSTTPGLHSLTKHGGSTFVVTQQKVEEDERLLEWDGEDQRGQGSNGEDQPLLWDEEDDNEEDDNEENKDGEEASAQALEELRTDQERGLRNRLGGKDYLINRSPIKWEPEPQLEASQIEEIENRIGGGLIEEVIQVAEGELKLVDTMVESKVWEDLEETPAEGQWEYFTLDRHMPVTPGSPK